MKKKIILYTFMILTVMVAFNACGGDDYEPTSREIDDGDTNGTDYKNLIVGYWSLKKPETNNQKQGNELYVFYQDQKTAKVYINYDAPMHELVTYDMEYYVKGDELHVTKLTDQMGNVSTPNDVYIIYISADEKMATLSNNGSSKTYYRLNEMPQIVPRQTMYAEWSISDFYPPLTFNETLAYVYFYSTNNEKPRISTDVDWLRVEYDERRTPSSTTIFGVSVTQYGVRVYPSFNRGAERYGQIIFKRDNGEAFALDVTQTAYSSMVLDQPGMNYTFTYNGTTYLGFDLNSGAGDPACVFWVFNYDDNPIYYTSSASWCWVKSAILVPGQSYGERRAWRYEISKSKNNGSDRMATITFYKDDGSRGTCTILQYGTNDSGGGTGGGTGGSATSNYDITRTSVCAIYGLDNKQDGDKYTKSYYKWVSKTNSRNVILSTSSTSNSGWIGVASNNYDSSCRGYNVSGYRYKFVDYKPVGGAWYYYFN